MVLHRHAVSLPRDDAARSVQGVSITSPPMCQPLLVQKTSHLCLASQMTTADSCRRTSSIGVPQHLFHLICQGYVGYSLGF